MFKGYSTGGLSLPKPPGTYFLCFGLIWVRFGPIKLFFLHFFYNFKNSETLDTRLKQLGAVFLGDAADTCSVEFSLTSMGGRAKGLVCADPIVVSGNFHLLLLLVLALLGSLLIFISPTTNHPPTRESLFSSISQWIMTKEAYRSKVGTKLEDDLTI